MNDIPNSVCISMAAIEARLTDDPLTRQRVEVPSPDNVKAVAREAMRHAHDEKCTWSCSSDDERFKSGVGALMLFFADAPDVTAIITHEMKILGALSAAMTGIPVDWVAIGDGPDGAEPYGLMGIYREVARS